MLIPKTIQRTHTASNGIEIIVSHHRRKIRNPEGGSVLITASTIRTRIPDVAATKSQFSMSAGDTRACYRP
jgi:hypothetical protein